MPRVLGVDGDADVLDLVEHIFRDAGWAVKGSASAARARVRLGHSEFDLVVIDLPGETGLSLARHARALGLPVLLMSGDITATAEHEEPDLPLIRKPFRVGAMLEAAVDVLNSGSGSRGAATA
jgi:DNA-binding NtrC family response regulator